MPDVNIVPVLKAIEEIVVAARTTGSVPRANATANLLRRRFPDCGLSAGEIATLFLEECIVQGLDSPEVTPRSRRAG